MLTIHRPVKSDKFVQGFAENLACTQVDATGSPIIPYRINNGTFPNSCPTGYAKLYPLFGLPNGHNGYDLGLYHGEPIYHSGDYNGFMRTHVDHNGGVGVDIVSHEELLYHKHSGMNYKHHIKLRHWHIKSVNGWDGKQVKPGDLIGYGDNTGVSGGNHDHFSLKWCDEKGNGIHSDNGFWGALDQTPYYTNAFILDILNLKQQLSLAQRVLKLLYQIQSLKGR